MEVENISDIHTLYTVLEEYLELLAIEQNALLTSNVDLVNDIAKQKVEILNVFAKIDTQLLNTLSVATSSSNDSSRFQIQNLLDRCKSLNSENSALVNQGLKVCRSTLSYLNRDSKPAISPLYDGNGMVAESVANRLIGKA